MRIVATALRDVILIDVEPITDERGFFARTWDRAELAARGLTAEVEQVSVSFNETAGTLRGLHFQEEPHAETRMIRCTAGAIFDVAVDLREDSPSRYRWVGVELSATNRRSIYVPEGCAHGYVTLTDGAEVQYQSSAPYRPDAARGYRWNDPTLAIDWPVPIRRISIRDAELPYVGGTAPA